MKEFSINEVHIMNNNKQLDMLISSPPDSDSPKKNICKISFRENITKRKY